MTSDQLAEKIISLIPSATQVENCQIPTFFIPSDKILESATKLKDNPETSFDYLFCLTGMDWEDSLGIVYHIESTKFNHQAVLKIKTEDRNNPEFDSVCGVWKTAEFHEREVFDFFGIKFTNHPDLRRMFLDEEWQGYPLRKDYVDEKNIIQR